MGQSAPWITTELDSLRGDIIGLLHPYISQRDIRWMVVLEEWQHTFLSEIPLLTWGPYSDGNNWQPLAVNNQSSQEISATAQLRGSGWDPSQPHICSLTTLGLTCLSTTRLLTTPVKSNEGALAWPASISAASVGPKAITDLRHPLVLLDSRFPFHTPNTSGNTAEPLDGGFPGGVNLQEPYPCRVCAPDNHEAL